MDQKFLTGTDWLNDELIDAGQELLKQQFEVVPGLQSVVLGRTLAFCVEPTEFVQVLHTGQGHCLPSQQ